MTDVTTPPVTVSYELLLGAVVLGVLGLLVWLVKAMVVGSDRRMTEGFKTVDRRLEEGFKALASGQAAQTKAIDRMTVVLENMSSRRSSHAD